MGIEERSKRDRSKKLELGIKNLQRFNLWEYF